MKPFVKETRAFAQGLHPYVGAFSRRDFEWSINKDVFRAMLDNAPFTEPVRQSCNCATGRWARKVIKEELILKTAVAESRNTRSGSKEARLAARGVCVLPQCWLKRASAKLRGSEAIDAKSLDRPDL